MTFGRASLKIAYREDAIPFSLKSVIGEPTGLIVNLRRAVVAKMAADLSMAEIKITYVPVTAANRFDAIDKGQADLPCTSNSLSTRHPHLSSSPILQVPSG